MDADGGRLLFVEEVQSDWGADGKKKGFAEPGKGWEAKNDEAGRWDVYNDGEYQATVDAASEEAAIGMMLGRKSGIPAAPFVTKTEGWLNLALKRVITLAVEGGYDKVAFVTGQQSADRYHLSRQIDEIAYTPRAGGRYDIGANKDGNQVIFERDVDIDRVGQLIGKELAQRVADGVGEPIGSAPTPSFKLPGLDLQVGGEGMKAFYDTIVPNAVKALLKKVGGGQLEGVNIPLVTEQSTLDVVDDEGELILRTDYDSEAYSIARQYPGSRVIKTPSIESAPTQPGFSITPAMREKVSGGQPLFSRRNPQEETPAFKRWFGDWESARNAAILKGEPLARVSTSDVPAGGFKAVEDWAAELFAQQGGVAVREGFGEVVLDRRAAKTSMAHGGANRYKKAAFAAVKDVIERGALVLSQSDAQEDSFYFSAPVDIDGTINIETVLVHRDPNTRRMYLHSVTIKENLLNQRVSSADAAAEAGAPGRSGSTNSGGVTSVLQKLLNFNSDSVSKVVDAEGMPLVVYHSTTSDISEFDPEKAYNGAFYFSDDPQYAGVGNANILVEGANTMPVFVSLKNPIMLGFDEIQLMTAEDVKRYKSQGYDGAMLADDELSSTNEIVAFYPEQIKSAIGNNGNFDLNNPDIRFSRQAAGQLDPLAQALREMLASEKALEQLRSGDAVKVTLEQWMALSDRSLSAKKALTAELAKRPDDGFGLQAQASGGRMVTLTQSAQQPGKWQLTRFDAEGAPWGDTNYASKDQAIREFIEEADLATLVDAEGAPLGSKQGQVRAENFERWFGDSKVLDADGKPLVVYHGASAEFSEFLISSNGEWGAGIYFTNIPDAAAKYAERAGGSPHVMPVHVAISNPANQKAVSAARAEVGQMMRDGLIDVEQRGKEMQRLLQKRGYDGVLVRARNGDTEVVAFRPEQVKSAIGNNGEFDAANPDIRYSQVRLADVGPLGYFSALARGIEGLDSSAAPAAGWKDAIKGLINKGAVKQDEVKWSGVMEWLDLQPGRVTREQLLAHIRGNGVQVDEVVLEARREIALEWSEWSQPDDLGDSVSLSSNGMYRLAKDADGILDLYDERTGETIREGMDDEAFLKEYAEMAGGRKDLDALPKYSEYTLPGGENYREVLLMLPVAAKPFASYDQWWRERTAAGKKASAAEYGMARAAHDAAQPAFYKSSHWERRNVLAHLRVNDRVDADGAKVLFVEEIQSDWGADGKKKGFRGHDGQKGEPLSDQEHARALSLQNKERNTGRPLTSEERQEFDALMARHTRAYDGLMVPTAPFVTKTDGWLNLALKRVIMMAVDGGYDKVAFVNGQQSADRYELSKWVSSISSAANPDGTYDIKMAMHSGESQHLRGKTVKDVEEAVGKAMAGKAIAAADAWLAANKAYRIALSKADTPKSELDRLRVERDSIETEFSGLDLKVGGEGMVVFYDQIVPNALKTLLKKVGGQLEGVALDGESFNTDQAAADDALLDELGVKVEGRRPATQPGFAITPAMREKLAVKGVPLFSQAVSDKAQAKPRKVYHYSPSVNRESIAEKGLSVRADRTGMNAVFLSDACRLQPGMDVYEVDAQGLDLEEDGTTDAPEGERWFAVFGDIEKQKIRPVLLDKEKQSSDNNHEEKDEDGCEFEEAQWPRVRHG